MLWRYRKCGSLKEWIVACPHDVSLIVRGACGHAGSRQRRQRLPLQRLKVRTVGDPAMPREEKEAIGRSCMMSAREVLGDGIAARRWDRDHRLVSPSVAGRIDAMTRQSCLRLLPRAHGSLWRRVKALTRSTGEAPMSRTGQSASLVWRRSRSASKQSIRG